MVLPHLRPAGAAAQDPARRLRAVCAGRHEAGGHRGPRRGQREMGGVRNGGGRRGRLLRRRGHAPGLPAAAPGHPVGLAAGRPEPRQGLLRRSGGPGLPDGRRVPRLADGGGPPGEEPQPQAECLGRPGRPEEQRACGRGRGRGRRGQAEGVGAAAGHRARRAGGAGEAGDAIRLAAGGRGMHEVREISRRAGWRLLWQKAAERRLRRLLRLLVLEVHEQG
mmetsp:Transcript_36609/g.105299  ORF Transcript_36609/g.105299 Transcript_36609/m.105299 type:complete len:221 (+) Transcript_36609:862-1524(+)